MMDFQAYDSIMTPSADGHWVLKSDVNKYISDLTAEIERLKEYEALYKGAVLVFEEEQKEHKATRRALCLVRFAFAKLMQDYIGRYEYNESNLDDVWEKRADYWKAKAAEFK